VPFNGMRQKKSVSMIKPANTFTLTFEGCANSKTAVTPVQNFEFISRRHFRYTKTRTLPYETCGIASLQVPFKKCNKTQQVHATLIIRS